MINFEYMQLVSIAFTRSICVRGAQKCKKVSLFMLLGSACAKASRKYVGKIDTRRWRMNLVIVSNSLRVILYYGPKQQDRKDQ